MLHCIGNATLGQGAPQKMSAIKLSHAADDFVADLYNREVKLDFGL